jgi:uncharacterized protein YgbK (DUF1537 family)
MTADASAALTIVADDLTGACDTGALFAGRGPVPITVWPDTPVTAPVSVIDTESRAADAEEAAARVARAAAGRERCFKKIDSTLRGRVGAELDALLRATGAATAVVCPALPAEGRAVVERVLTVHAVPVAETAIADDPAFPRAAGSSSVVDLLRSQLDRPLAWIPLAQVREGPSALAARLERLRGTVAVADAETDEDLDRLVAAVLALPQAPLLAGAAGLGRALAARLGLLADRVEPPAGRRWLVAAGSLHPATRRQIDVARAAGLRVLATPPDPGADRARAAARLAEEVVAALAREETDVLVVTGGETAVAVFRALGATRIDLVGAPAPGLAWGWLAAPRRPPLAVLTKAGGFGAPDLFVALVMATVA